MASWTVGGQLIEYVQRLQAEGKLVSPVDLVRQVKQGPGTATLGEAQNAARLQTEEQAGIEAETLAAVTRLEALWTGRSSEAARAGMRPLADVASSASAALATSQRTMNDQANAFDSTKNSMVEIAESPPQRGMLDVLTPWDTSVEDEVNARNAAIEQNERIYQGFSQTSSTHSAVMPIDYGQIEDASDANFTLASADEPAGPPAAGRSAPEVRGGPESTGYIGGTAPTPPAVPASHGTPDPQPGADRTDAVPATNVPAASDDTTRAASYVPPPVTPPAAGPQSFGPTGPGVPGGGYPPSGYGTGGYVSGSPGAPGPGGQSGYRYPGGGYRAPGGAGASGGGGGSSSPRGPGGAGRMTGAGPVGGASEPGRVGGGATGSGTGARGGAMPVGAAGGGRGGKGEDSDRKTPEYLKEADPQQVFGYDGKATPPVIGEKKN